ncbi:MAG: hypothetical protein JWO32_1567, partial [Bacteroidetes bacterium]|nr:hypothetical protein [Bacteroidota bacterium]
MTKFQKIAFSVFIILSIVLGYFGYVVLKHTKQPSIRAITLIPDSCSVLVTFDDYKEFANSLRNKNLLWQDVRAASCFTIVEKHFNYFDSLINSNSEFADLTVNNPVHIAVYPNHQFIIALNLRELSEDKTFRKLLPTVLNSSVYKLKYILKEGVLCISDNELFLQKAFDSKTAKLFNNSNFTTLKEPVNYTGTSIFVHNPGTFNNTYSTINIKPESITLNGIKKTNAIEFYGDPLSPPLNSYEFLETIPILCNAFEVYAIKNAETVFSHTSVKDWWSEVNNEALFNAKKQFYENIGTSIITALLPSNNKALIINIKDSLRLSEILPYMKDTSNKGQGNIYKLRKSTSSFITSTFSNLKLQDMNFFIPFNNYLIITKDKNDAEIFVNARANNTSILQNEAFKTYASKNLNTEFHYLHYFLVNSLKKEQLLFGDLLKKEDIQYLKNISHCSFVSSYEKGFLNYRFYIKYFQDDILDEPNVLW